MVVLDSVGEFNFKSIKKEAHVAPVAAEIELQSASKVGPTQLDLFRCNRSICGGHQQETGCIRCPTAAVVLFDPPSAN
jgi:hypothetical protein